MDRRNNNETAGDLTDEQFRKALEVITDSYKGASADRLYRDAIGCFDCLIEISNNTDATLACASRHDIDIKYLVDGANFVISRMHFNPESNYYITLGLSQNVSHEEIRERWKKLMLIYHPDRQGGDDSWVSERAKKVNEAYSILKDNQKRQAFDRKLLEQAMARKPVLQSGKAPGAAPSSSRKISRNPEWDRKKKNIPKFLVGAYLVAALVFLSYLYLQNNGELLESALGRKEVPKEMADRIDTAYERENLKAVRPPGQDRPGESIDKGNAGLQSLHLANPPSNQHKTWLPAARPEPGNAGNSAPTSAAENTRDIARRETGADKVVANEDSAPKKTAPILTQPATKTALDLQPRTQEPGSKLYIPLVKDVPAADHSTGKTETQRPVSQETPSAHPASDVQTAELTHEEVEDFIRQYSSSYAKGDLNLFMSFFSKSVLENNRLHYNAVREAYRETFSEKIGFYKVNNMTVVIKGPIATVSGYYDLKRYASVEDRWLRYSGRIQWKISKENNALKIISINYDK